MTDNGPSDSVVPVTVDDPLPAGLTYVSGTTGTAGTWSCAAAVQNVTCTDSAAIVVAADEVSTVDGIVAAAPDVPDSGASGGGGRPPPLALGLVLTGLLLAAGSRRRWRLGRTGRVG